MDITTINTVGKPRVSKVTIKELYTSGNALGVPNYVRDTAKVDSFRPWWTGKSVRQFAIGPKGIGSREAGVWENVAKSIEKQAKSD
jgi:hypothetical protein